MLFCDSVILQTIYFYLKGLENLKNAFNLNLTAPNITMKFYF